MTQFIRDNIDIISSRTSRPVTHGAEMNDSESALEADLVRETPTSSQNYEFAHGTSQPNKLYTGDMRKKDSEHTYSPLSFDAPHGGVTSFRTNAGFTILCSEAGQRVWDATKLLFTGRAPERAYDPERQPLIRMPQREHDTPQGSPSDDNYSLFIDNRILLSIVVLALFIFLGLIILYTGDTQLLLRVLKAFLCYFLGSSLLESLFGPNFCVNLTGT